MTLERLLVEHPLPPGGSVDRREFKADPRRVIDGLLSKLLIVTTPSEQRVVQRTIDRLEAKIQQDATLSPTSDIE